MPLYLASWPDGRVTLASASCLIELFDRLDTAGDVTKCSIQEYGERDVCLTFQPKDPICKEE